MVPSRFVAGSVDGGQPTTEAAAGVTLPVTLTDRFLSGKLRAGVLVFSAHGSFVVGFSRPVFFARSPMHHSSSLEEAAGRARPGASGGCGPDTGRGAPPAARCPRSAPARACARHRRRRAPTVTAAASVRPPPPPPAPGLLVLRGASRSSIFLPFFSGGRVHAVLPLGCLFLLAE